MRVQVKCTSGLTISGHTKSSPITETWVGQWHKSHVPVYLVIVVVPDDGCLGLNIQSMAQCIRPQHFGNAWIEIPSCHP